MNDLTVNNSYTPVDVNLDEILVDYGLEGAELVSTVIQQGDSLITIPNNISSNNQNNMLEPPEINTHNNTSEIDALINEVFNSPEALNAVLDSNNEDYPVENPDLLLSENESNNDEADSNLIEDEVDSLTEQATSSNEENLEDGDGIADNENDLLANENTDEIDNLLEELESEMFDSTPETNKMSITEILTLLPDNPKMIGTDVTTSRFSGAVWYKAIQESTIILAGLGGIGSYILFCLSRMHPKQIFIYDDDRVDQSNLGGQLYSLSMINKYKVDAMADLARDFSNYYGVHAIRNKFTLNTNGGDIMICGFDNMEARHTFFNVWLSHLVNHPHPEKCLYIDGRL